MTIINAINEWLFCIALAFMRPLGMALFFPLLKSSNLGSAFLRNGVLLSLLLPVLPVIHEQLRVYQHGAWLSVVVSEIMIGIIIGFFAAIPFWAIDMAGFLIDSLRGATMGTVYNPTMEIQTTIFGLIFTQFLCVLFLASGSFNLLLNVLYHSYYYYPPGKSLAFDRLLLDFLVEQWRTLYQLCIVFSLPAVICMLLADLALGLLNRSAQQLNVFFLSMPVKSALALFLLFLTLPAIFHFYLIKSNALFMKLDHFLGATLS